MPNLLESAERLYKRISGGTQRFGRRVDTRSNDGTNLSSNQLSSEGSTPWRSGANRANSASNLVQVQRSDSNEFSNQPHALPRLGHPLGDFTAVSSESDVEDGEASNSAFKFHAEVRNQRLRQSIQRANNADFESGTCVQGRYASAERLYARNVEDYDDDDVDDDDDDDDDDEEEDEAKECVDDAPNRGDLDNVDGAYEEPENEKVNQIGGGDRGYLHSQILQSRTGVRWSADPPQPLVDILPKIRRGLAPPNTEFVRATCQRSTCRCLLKGHDTLMLFPLFDAVLCEATWEKIKDSQSSSSSGGRSASHFLSRFQHIHSSGPSSETQAKLILFRQCRGWYEVMNENHEPVPHWTSTEELRCAKPSTFLVRRDLPCLLAPYDLWLPPQAVERITPTSNNEPAPPPPPALSSRLISVAANPKTISSSTPTVLKPGTLLSYVDYLPDCTVTRAKKFKQISLVLATEKTRAQRQGESPASPRKLFYIGTEDASNLAAFPTKLALSPIAGPENISGVHTLSSLLRKFRLPLSIVPVAVPEKKLGPCGSSTSILSSESESTNYATAQSSKPVNIFPTVPNITFTERNYMRLRRLLRGDVMIVAPVDDPDRFFLITPTLLQDHLFQLGFTEDDRYKRLALRHRNRTINFISMAHPRESLDYLLNYLKDITNRPRVVSSGGAAESVGRELWNRLKAGVLQTFEITPEMARVMYAETGKDPRAGPASELTPDEIDMMYDEMDDLYFFTRNGYFPPKSRQRRQKMSTVVGMQQNQALSGLMHSKGTSETTARVSGIPSAEQLLAATLNISAYK